MYEYIFTYSNKYKNNLSLFGLGLFLKVANFQKKFATFGFNISFPIKITHNFNL